MSRAIVRCRCGHQVLAKEVLRTDLYERPTGREYVYVKFRCRRCKRLGEAFVAENRWDWSILEPVRNEMSESERDQFLDHGPITELEVVEFQSRLKRTSRVSELSVRQPTPEPPVARPLEPSNGSKPAASKSEDPAIIRPRATPEEIRLKGQSDDTTADD